ncbi:MAG: YaeQ family protein [Anaerolineales bacterium]|nr:YaeQ family protein [Anaerolineales bacterium]
MALGATIYNFNIALADMDRGVYETLDLRVALHPSEAAEHMLTRVLAYCLEYQDGIAFSKGLADADQPALWVHDRTGQLKVWIDIGAPTAERLHRANKLAERVVVYTHKDIAILKHNLGRAPIHQAAQIPLYVLDRRFIADFEARLERRLTCALAVTERQLYLDVGGHSLQTTVVEHRLG